MRGSERYLAGKIGSWLWDISGAFGDIGVLLPLTIVLIAKNGFNPTALFLCAGLFYIGSAYYFKITMPVQPLKAMSAIAIATGLSVEVMNAAGIMIGIILLVISLTGLSVRLGAIFPVSVIRGIQLGLGALLIKTSFPLMYADATIALIAGILLLITLLAMKRIPPLILLLIMVIILAMKEIKLPSIGPLPLTPSIPDLNFFWTGLILLVLPQLGLTFGNAIVATEATAKLLYGGRAKRVNLKNIPLSMSLANLISGFAGGVPMCHGSGGMTAHFKFGARTERSGYIMGLTLVGLGLLLGDEAVAVISFFPGGILGTLLCYVGLQHSLFIKDILPDKPALFIAITVALTGFITNNLTIGFLLGFGIHYGLLGFRKSIEYGGRC